jgi:hypothetical protein
MQGTWNRNMEHQGIQVFFPSKPDLEVIHDLKNAGFKWSDGKSMVSGRLLGRPADPGSRPACSHNEGQSQDLEGEVRSGVDERIGHN